MKIKITILVLIIICVLSGCASPSPLTGTWSDNAGNKIVFSLDGTFLATIMEPMEITYEGEFNVLLNSLVFTKSSGGTIVTEWDIRGNMLYLIWTDPDGEGINMTLYKTSN